MSDGPNFDFVPSPKQMLADMYDAEHEMLRQLYAVVKRRHNLTEAECKFIKLSIKETFAKTRKELIDSQRNGNRRKYERKLTIHEES